MVPLNIENEEKKHFFVLENVKMLYGSFFSKKNTRNLKIGFKKNLKLQRNIYNPPKEVSVWR